MPEEKKAAATEKWWEIPASLLRRERAQAATVDEKSVYRLIDIKGSISTIEITLTAITIAVIILKISFDELATQIASLVAGGAARAFLDVSISVGFIAIVIATVQIPRHFTDTLIYSNSDTMRVLFIVGAQPDFVATCFAKVVGRAVLRAVSQGMIATALLYLFISEVAQLWVPITRTYFLREVAEVVAGIFVFSIVVHYMVKSKVASFYRSGTVY